MSTLFLFSKAVSNELAKILYCDDPAYSCNENTTCQWEKCRCSGNSTADTVTGCQCDSGLTVCNKSGDRVTPTSQDIVDTKSSTELYFTYVVLEQSKEFNFGNLGTPRFDSWGSCYSGSFESVGTI